MRIQIHRAPELRSDINSTTERSKSTRRPPTSKNTDKLTGEISRRLSLLHIEEQHLRSQRSRSRSRTRSLVEQSKTERSGSRNERRA